MKCISKSVNNIVFNEQHKVSRQTSLQSPRLPSGEHTLILQVMSVDLIRHTIEGTNVVKNNERFVNRPA